MTYHHPKWWWGGEEEERRCGVVCAWGRGGGVGGRRGGWGGTCLSMPPNVKHLNMGCRVPVVTTPDPVPVYRARKIPHSPSQSSATAQPSQFSAVWTTKHMLLHATGMQQYCPSKNTTSCNCGISAVSSKTAPEELAGPTHQNVDHLVTRMERRAIWIMGISIFTTTQQNSQRAATVETQSLFHSGT